MVHRWSLLQHNMKWKLRENDCGPLKKVSTKSSLGLPQVHEEGCVCLCVCGGGGCGGVEEAIPALILEAPTNKMPPERMQQRDRRGLRREGAMCFTQ